jgi:poly(3-hydroxybutyrate) depolymerase
VFITGLSAGGAMTAVMLACYPEVFAGGAIIAGLPYGGATNVQQAIASMFQGPARSARKWGDLVRAAAAHDGPWPRVSVWHGNADRTVIPSNARETLKQWTEVHGLPVTPSAQAMVDGYPRQVWVNEAGDELIESYTITHMAHGTPLAAGDADDECGAAGPLLLEVGISSSYHIARFFGLTIAGLRHVASTKSATAMIAPVQRRRVSGPAAALAQLLAPAGKGADEELVPLPPVDIGAVITKAFKAAGLTKSR